MTTKVPRKTSAHPSPASGYDSMLSGVAELIEETRGPWHERNMVRRFSSVCLPI